MPEAQPVLGTSLVVPKPAMPSTETTAKTTRTRLQHEYTRYSALTHAVLYPRPSPSKLLTNHNDSGRAQLGRNLSSPLDMPVWSKMRAIAVQDFQCSSRPTWKYAVSSECATKYVRSKLNRSPWEPVACTEVQDSPPTVGKSPRWFMAGALAYQGTTSSLSFPQLDADKA